MIKEININSLTGAKLLLRFSNDTESPIIFITTISKKDVNTLKEYFNNNKISIQNHFRRIINDVNYKMFDKNKFKINKDSEAIEISESEIAYKTNLILL